MNWLPEALLQDPEFRHWVMKPTEELNRAWTARLAGASEEQHEWVRQARTILRSLPAEATLSDEEAASMWETIRNRSESTPVVQPLPVSWNRAVSWYRVAAVLTLISVAGWLGWRSYSERKIKIHTASGQIRQFSLPDGSLITLNSNSTLSYPANWSQLDQRQVWLEGEAYFKVTKQRLHQQPVKFTVHSADVTIEVLGTQFNVKNRRGLVNVVLDEGKIQVSKLSGQVDHPQMLMKPGDVVEFSKAQKTFRHQLVKQPELYSSWTHNVLIFNNTPLQEIARTLEDTYQLKVTFAQDSLASLPFTGNLPASDPNAILKTLSKAFDLQITHTDEQHITIQSR